MTDEKINGEVVEDARTGEIIPAGSPPGKNGMITYIDVGKVGSLEFDEETIKVIQEPIDPNDVKIRPDGLVYLPWPWYNKRLNRAFGFGKWGIVPSREPVVKKIGNFELIVWLHWLIVKTVPIANAGGEATYNPNNSTMSYGDALEGARSNSLSRCCKNLGMALDLWDADWVENWKNEYAEQYYDEDKRKKLWRKKGSGDGKKSKKTEPATEPTKTEATTEEVKAAPEEPKGDEVKKYKVSTLRTLDMVKAIASQSHKKNSEVAAVINSLDSKVSYSIAEVVSKVMGEQNAKS